MHDIVSIICFQVMSAIVLAPKRIALSSSTVKSSGSSRPRERVRPNQTLTAAVAMWRCFECGRYARKPTTSRTCAQTKIRSRASAQLPSPKTWAIAFETGDHEAGHSFRPVAISAACQSSSVSTISAISPRMRSASPRWLPLNRSGRCTLRIQNAEVTPTSTSTTKRSTRNANQPCDPSHGSVSPFATAPISAITIVGKRTRKPQKMSAWMRPGPRRWNSFFWPSTTTASLRTRLRHVVEALHRLAEADEAGEQERAAAEERARDAEDDEEGEGGDRRAHRGQNDGFVTPAAAAAPPTPPAPPRADPRRPRSRRST